MAKTEAIRVLVTVKAYPAISRRHGEVVCVAGVRTDTPRPEWVRLFPVPFRDLAFQDRFKKYQEIEVSATRRGGSDTRPESWQPDPDTIHAGSVLDPKHNWAKRKAHVLPLVISSMCEIQRRQAEDRTSLGVFKPAAVDDFDMERDDSEWDAEQQAVVAQPSLLFPTKAGLEKIPYRFRYRYRCDEQNCGGHFQSIIDWELAESYRSWLPRYGPDLVREKLREKWLETMWHPDRDSYLFVGNQHQWPESFLVLGVFWPKKES
jgi:hypothetical protein